MTIEQLVNEVSFWDSAQHSMNETPYDSNVRKTLGRKIYGNENIFTAVSPDTIDEHVKNEKDFADATWINYVMDNRDEVLNAFNTENLFSSYAVQLCPELMNLKMVEDNEHAKTALMLEKYKGKLTKYSASDSMFLKRLYDATVEVEYAVLQQKLSKKVEDHYEMDKEKVKKYVSDRLDSLDKNIQMGVYEGFAKNLYRQAQRE